MLTFKDKAEEEFWKAAVVSSGSVVLADLYIESLRRRQPTQGFPVLDNKVI